MAITRSDELRHSPAARDTKSSAQVTTIIIRSLNNILLETVIRNFIAEYFLIHFLFDSVQHTFVSRVQMKSWVEQALEELIPLEQCKF
jgi:hypothetical protein